MSDPTVYPAGDVAITIGPSVSPHGVWVPGGQICWARPSNGRFIVIPDVMMDGSALRLVDSPLWMAIVADCHLGIGRVAGMMPWPEGPLVPSPRVERGTGTL